jgi:hypothetical protein
MYVTACISGLVSRVFYNVSMRQRLYYLNIVTITIHICSAILSSVVPVNSFNEFNLTYRVLHRQQDGHIDSVLTYSTHTTVYLRWIVVTFFLLSAFFQFTALKCKRYHYFERVGLPQTQIYEDIQIDLHLRAAHHSVHWLRFVEYAFSASVMLAGIALLTGITDINEVFCICTLCAATQLFGLLCELNLDTEHHHQAILAHLAGWFTFLASYGTIASHYLSGVYATAHPGQHIPWWVHMIVISMSVMFSMFGAVQVGRILSPDIFTIYKSEHMYVIMSLLTKTALGWMILGVALRPT